MTTTNELLAQARLYRQLAASFERQAELSRAAENEKQVWKEAIETTATEQAPERVRWMRTERAARYMDCSVATIRNMVQRGALLPHMAPGSTTPYYDADEIDRMLEAGRQHERAGVPA